MTPRLLLIPAAALGALAACTAPTPEKVLRVEGSAPIAPTLCERMAEDFDMVLAEGSALRGRTWRVSHATRAFSSEGVGVSWGFRLNDQNPEETCATTSNGMICDITGPAEFRIQSNAGRATYMVAAGDIARVASEGATMTCFTPPAGP